eukprot:1764611-Rhodomonas_salina.2
MLVCVAAPDSYLQTPPPQQCQPRLASVSPRRTAPEPSATKPTSDFEHISQTVALPASQTQQSPLQKQTQHG